MTTGTSEEGCSGKSRQLGDSVPIGKDVIKGPTSVSLLGLGERVRKCGCPNRRTWRGLWSDSTAIAIIVKCPRH